MPSIADYDCSDSHPLVATQLPAWYPVHSEHSLKSVFIPLPLEFLRYLQEDGVFLPDDSAAVPQLAELDAALLVEGDYRRDDWDSQPSAGPAAGAAPAAAVPQRSPSGPLHSGRDGLLSGSLRSSDLQDAYGASAMRDSDGDSGSEASPGGARAVDWTVRFPQLRASLDAAIAALGGRVVPKLNWSCPTDALWVSAAGSLACRNAEQVVLLLKSSDRVAHDVTLLMAAAAAAAGPETGAGPGPGLGPGPEAHAPGAVATTAVDAAGPGGVFACRVTATTTAAVVAAAASADTDDPDRQAAEMASACGYGGYGGGGPASGPASHPLLREEERGEEEATSPRASGQSDRPMGQQPNAPQQGHGQQQAADAPRLRGPHHLHAPHHADHHRHPHPGGEIDTAELATEDHSAAVGGGGCGGLLQPVLVLKKWCDMRSEGEFRCFVRGGALVAASQRDVSQAFPALATDAGAVEEMRRRLWRFWGKHMKGSLPLQDFAFDVYVPSGSAAVQLVDVNPLTDTTSPLLYDWAELGFGASAVPPAEALLLQLLQPPRPRQREGGDVIRASARGLKAAEATEGVAAAAVAVDGSSMDDAASLAALPVPSSWNDLQVRIVEGGAAAAGGARAATVAAAWPHELGSNVHNGGGGGSGLAGLMGPMLLGSRAALAMPYDMLGIADSVDKMVEVMQRQHQQRQQRQRKQQRRRQGEREGIRALGDPYASGGGSSSSSDNPAGGNEGGDEPLPLGFPREGRRGNPMLRDNVRQPRAGGAAGSSAAAAAAATVAGVDVGLDVGDGVQGGVSGTAKDEGVGLSEAELAEVFGESSGGGDFPGGPEFAVKDDGVEAQMAEMRAILGIGKEEGS